jgi:hypothetical protein
MPWPFLWPPDPGRWRKQRLQRHPFGVGQVGRSNYVRN